MPDHEAPPGTRRLIWIKAHDRRLVKAHAPERRTTMTMPSRPASSASLRDRLAALRQRIRTMLDDARARAALRRDLAQIERAGELDRVLADLGLSRDGVPLLVKNHPRSARLLAG